MSTILIGLLITGVSLAVPLLLAALGELVAEKSGVINVGIEGTVLMGAFGAFAGSHYTHSAFGGALCGIACALLLASLFIGIGVYMGADQVVAGTAINILSLGLTGVLNRGLFNGNEANPPRFNPVPLPLLHSIPVLGPTVFSQSLLGYCGWLLVPITWAWLMRTRAGLCLRAAGEYPAAADAVGASVVRIRAGAVLWGAALAGLAGAYLSIGYNSGFVENMSAGRGFIALAVVILGRWNPFGVLIAALFFGVAMATQYQFQALHTAFPYQFFLALPYLLTLGALLVRRGKSYTAAPGFLGQPFRRI